jgi:SAM-dependent methyltransferase
VTPYDSTFFENLSSSSRAAASIVLPFVMQLVRPTSVLDVGCGSGEWLAVWSELGLEDVVGVDGVYVEGSTLSIPQDKFRPVDLANETVALGRRFDLVSSLEVGEHLPAESAARFVSSLTQHGDVVLFSAAAPGQGGVDHVNEQWPPYWVNLFSAQGFDVLDVLRPRFWDDEQIVYYFRQNTMLFARSPDLIERCQQMPSFGGRAVVHPNMYWTYRQDKGVRDLAGELGRAVRRRLPTRR